MPINCTQKAMTPYFCPIFPVWSPGACSRQHLQCLARQLQDTSARLQPRTDLCFHSMPEALWAHRACWVTWHQVCAEMLLVSQEVLWWQSEEGLAAPGTVACMGLQVRMSTPRLHCLLKDPNCNKQSCYKGWEFYSADLISVNICITPQGKKP